jgi:UDP-3-O-[3-hydroxymyristoyl] glucosamine N-acyltransferase
MKLPVEMTLGQIAAVVGGRVKGSADIKVNSVATSPLAATSSDLALIFEKEMLKRIGECKAAAIMVPEGTDADRPLIVVERPMLAIQRILTAAGVKRYFPEKGLHPTAVIDPTAELGANVAIGPLVVIGPGTKIGARTIIMANTVIGGEVLVGDDCLIYPGVILSDFVRIGNRVILQQGCSLGSDGYGYVTEKPSNLEKKAAGRTDFSDDENPLLKIPQIGTVIIEDDVEIGSNTTIDRATMGATIVGRGSKIDNLVMIAHNCRIGRECIVVGQAAIGGSTKINDRAVVAGNAGIKDHLEIGKDAIVEAMAGVMKDVPEHDVQVGVPATPVRQFFTEVAHVRRLPKMASEVKALQKRLAALEEKLAGKLED